MIRFGSHKVFPKEFYARNVEDIDIWVWEGNNIIQSIKWKEREEINFIKYDVGYEYDIIMFRKQLSIKKIEITHIERFNCCLISPPYYISSLVDNGYNGLVSKSFPGSKIIFDDLLKQYEKEFNIKTWLRLFMGVFNERIFDEK